MNLKLGDILQYKNNEEIQVAYPLFQESKHTHLRW